MENLSKKHGTLKEKQTILQEALSKDEDLLQSLLTGLSNNSNTNGGGYLAHLASAKSRLAQAVAEEEQVRRKISLKEKELSALEGNWRTVENEVRAGYQTVERKRGEVERLLKKLEDMTWSQDKEQDMAERSARLKQELKTRMEVWIRCNYKVLLIQLLIIYFGSVRNGMLLEHPSLRWTSNTPPLLLISIRRQSRVQSLVLYLYR